MHQRIEFNVFPKLQDSIDLEYLKSLNNYDLLDYECQFSINILGEIFFLEPNFCLLEFLKCISSWKDTCTDMKYISLETDDSPLISFERTQKGYLIASPWQKFECNEYFSKEELLEAISILYKLK